MIAESVPALFAGTVLTSFGAGLLLWTAAHVARHAPVVDHGRPAATAMASLFGTASLLAGVWCLLQV